MTTMPAKRRRSTPIDRDDAQGLVELVLHASRYFRHPDIEKILGYQVAGHAVIDLDEVAGYVQDNVLSSEPERPSRRDLAAIAKTLRDGASLLEDPRVAAIAFALPSTAVASRLREAARKIAR
jgi:hypothetical protein